MFYPMYCSASRLDAQANSLALLGAGQSTIDYVNNMKGDPYWQTPVADRYW